MSRRSIKQWKSRQARPVEVELSSGAVVELKRVSLSALLAQGLVPQSFFEMTGGKKPSEMTEEEKKAFAEETMSLLRSNPGALADMTNLARAVAKDALVWPRVVVNLSEAEDETTVDEIPVEDLFEIMNFALNDAPVQTSSGEVSADALRKTDGGEHVQGDSVDESNVSPVAE